MENEKDLREQIAQLQQKLDTIEQNTKPKPPRDYFALKLVGGVVGFFALIFVGWYAWACWWPLDNDKEIIKASTEAHDALNACGIYDHSKSCVVCHPFTWRWHVRQLRHEVP